MSQSLTIILADYLTGRISTIEALQRSNCQAVDDLVRAARSEGDEIDEYAAQRRRDLVRHAAAGRVQRL
ncbi:hypothetical protein GCM10011390_18520 [Aureimonas endophytica]|uniref:Uncharacterized protein n=1 Tax=Aureimonas endophytica TaxID=2027858 RepID=A0A917E495_9HYPH|nr:hypothetical protein [Aureimonas endophytica]GGE00017.1 hypothetical protein GCM10011390_18520 [Aureimonas endophytica]